MCLCDLEQSQIGCGDYGLSPWRMGGTTADEKNRGIVEAREVWREEVLRRRLRINGPVEMDNFLPLL